MKFCNVIVIKDGVVDENILVAGHSDAAVRVEAEKIFKDKLRENLSNFDEYTDGDVEELIDDGYEKFGNGSVCLSYPGNSQEDLSLV